MSPNRSILYHRAHLTALSFPFVSFSVREKTTETVTVQMMQEKEQEVAQMRSALCREREQQIKEVIRGKKEEIKTMKYK